MTRADESERAFRVLRSYGDDEFRRGVRVGLDAALKTLGWLTYEPNTRRQQLQRNSVRAAIVEICKRHGVEVPREVPVAIRRALKESRWRRGQ